LRARDRQSGLRNFEDLELLTKNNSFILFGDVTMPANNRLLIFKKIK